MTLKDRYHHAADKVAHTFPKAHQWLHLAYFGAVFIEGHGMYATFGGLLLLSGLIGLKLHVALET